MPLRSTCAGEPPSGAVPVILWLAGAKLTIETEGAPRSYPGTPSVSLPHYLQKGINTVRNTENGVAPRAILWDYGAQDMWYNISRMREIHL